MKSYLLFCIVVLCMAAPASAQDDYNSRAQKYIDEYASLAIKEQRQAGIPAAITLGQGILETEAGASVLMIDANNHFGIKCKSDWHGPVFIHTDDAPNERFKKYSSAEASYRDHSNLLRTNPRYMPLFRIPETNYKGWARCLKRCGYATNPQYAQRLIKIIEDFGLQQYTLTALNAPAKNSGDAALANTDAPKQPLVDPGNIAGVKKVIENMPPEKQQQPGGKPPVAPGVIKEQPVAKAPVARIPKAGHRPAAPALPPIANSEAPAEKKAEADADNSKMVIVNGLKAFYARKDQMLLQYAMKYHINYQQLLRMNDLADAPLPCDMYVYLERKLIKGTNAEHIVKNGETLLMVAQEEGMQLNSIRELNLLNPNEQPVTGSVLQLQTRTRQKPPVLIGANDAHNPDAVVTEGGTDDDSEYIAMNAATAADKPIAGNKESRDPDNDENAIPNDITDAEKIYTVRKGDTAYSIARRNNITLEQLTAWNNISGSNIKVGQTLKVKE